MNSGNGLTGLINLGNTCYVNACLQILSNIEEFNDYIDFFLKTFKFNKKDPNITFVKEWNLLKNLMWSKNCVVGPMRFLRMTKIIAHETNNDIFASEDQNDVTEFMYFLLECFHQGMKNVDNSMYTQLLKSLLKKHGVEYMKNIRTILHDDFSYVNTLFQGVFNISYVDAKDSTKQYSNKYESFRMLEIPVVDSNLMKNIHLAFQDEMFNEDNDNQYFHEDSNTYIDVVKRTNIYFLPKIMIIVLKRWNNAMRKSMRIVNFDNGIIDFHDYVNKDIRDMVCTKYKLKGIINHQGNIYGGHYTSLVENKNNKWYHFNDSNIENVEFKDLRGNKNYVLFFIRQ